jgi:hypothetical protein
MNEEKKREIYAALSAPFPADAVQRTDGKETGRGYSTTGIGHQHVVNRLNEVLGIGGFRVSRTLTVRETKTNSGRPSFETIAEVNLALGEWVDGAFVPFADAVGDGGHTSVSEADARKGAFTNGFKKAAALFGCGRQAYEGSLDDDRVPDEHRREPARADRNRLSGRQLNAIHSLARQRGLDAGALRDRVKRDFGVVPEFLSTEQASRLISEMSARAA